MPKNIIIIEDDPVNTTADTPEMRKKKLDWFKTIKHKIRSYTIGDKHIYDDLGIQREIGEVPNVDRDDPVFDLPGDDVGDK